MDLAKKFPRSPYDMNAGVVMLPRTTDKAKAFNEGTLGEYHYNCPLDKKVFEFFDIDAETFANKVKDLKTDKKIAEWLDKFGKTQKEKDKFNNMMRHLGPDTSEKKAWLKEQIKIHGKQVTTYFDNLDADEKRF
ncbi:MAG: DUF5069 domain-containing protein [Candidatus Aenigmarchaeota archaeon]|nr:DUF5069 domain-containing protein [Candidatus Aenigmarchaeota archaeon]MDI6722606.1 DUF5069 domain-containing protein [Candidatus Aenigmarchaeota archaeon]